MNQAILLSQSNDIDFMIHGIIPIEFMGTTVWITTSHACILIVMAVIIGFCVYANRVLKNATEVPGAAQNVIELIIELLQGMVQGSMGKWAPGFVNYIGTIFILSTNHINKVKISISTIGITYFNFIFPSILCNI